MSSVRYIDETEITGKRILVRVDYNVSLKSDGSINNDARIRMSLPTLTLLLQGKNKLVLMSHLGKPKGRDPKFSLAPVAKRLQELLPGYKVTLVDDFTSPEGSKLISNQAENEIMMLENTRFYEGEKKNDTAFSKALSKLGEVFVCDAFGSVHRAHASVVGVAAFLPSFGGLLLKKEITAILGAIENPAHPVVAIIAGAKISTKIGLIERLMEIADHVLIGGAMTNNFLRAEGFETGKGLIEEESVPQAKELLEQAVILGKNIVLPVDRRIGTEDDTKTVPTVKRISEIAPGDITLDIGPETEKLFGDLILSAQTIIWNGPVGYFENPRFAMGSVAILKAIAANPRAVSVVGGGDTLTVIKNRPEAAKIGHVSTGGGAMLELIEKGTLPGIDALKK